jgi:hypothetical protein
MISTEDALRREIGELRDELAAQSGGFEVRVQRRRELLAEIMQLRTELERLRTELERLRSEVALSRKRHRELRDQLEESRGQLRIDGQLLFDLIIGACPMILTDEAAENLARTAVDELTRVGPGVTVFRGDPDIPWLVRKGDDSPNRPPALAESMRYTDGCATARADASAVDAAILDDDDVEREVQYAVLVGETPAAPVEHAFCVTEANNYADAELVAAHVPGSWIGHRTVITQRWTPVDIIAPIR